MQEIKNIEFKVRELSIDINKIEKQLEVIDAVAFNLKRAKSRTENMLKMVNSDMWKWLWNTQKRKDKVEMQNKARLYWERRLIRETSKLNSYVRQES
tara:strand:- start:260 stop:550 length:291 start_codon:yes stop_codon:yes gene_type:complete